MSRSKQQNGFTLIELMIVVAIIGILASIALTQYQDYIARTQLSRISGEMAGYKSAIEDNLMQGEINFTLNDIGYVKSTLTLDMVISNIASAGGALPAVNPFNADGSGVIAVQIDNAGGNQGAANLVGTILNLSRNSNGIWQCIVDATTPIAAGNWKDSYIPSGCN